MLGVAHKIASLSINEASCINPSTLQEGVSYTRVKFAPYRVTLVNPNVGPSHGERDVILGVARGE